MTDDKPDTQRTSLGDALRAHQDEKQAARPLEIDFRAALALAVRSLEELMDDKYCALRDEIVELRTALTEHETNLHWKRPFVRLHRWWKRRRAWWSQRNAEYWNE
jgi:hypothetical protein